MPVLSSQNSKRLQVIRCVNTAVTHGTINRTTYSHSTLNDGWCNCKHIVFRSQFIGWCRRTKNRNYYKLTENLVTDSEKFSDCFGGRLPCTDVTNSYTGKSPPHREGGCLLVSSRVFSPQYQQLCDMCLLSSWCSAMEFKWRLFCSLICSLSIFHQSRNGYTRLMVNILFSPLRFYEYYLVLHYI